jgi:hypothetical protein
MTASKRALTLEDIAEVARLSAESLEAEAIYHLVECIAAETMGWRLITILRYVEAEGVDERAYSSEPKTYPVGGRKLLSNFTTNHAAMQQGEIFLAATKADVRQAYADHGSLCELAVTAILNVPIRHAGRRLGTMNLCGEEGMYGAAKVAHGRVLAGLLTPWLLHDTLLPDTFAKTSGD